LTNINLSWNVVLNNTNYAEKVQGLWKAFLQNVAQLPTFNEKSSAALLKNGVDMEVLSLFLF